MEWYTWVIAVVAGVVLGLMMNNRNKTNNDAIFELDKKDFYDNMRKGQLVDLRSEDDFKESKIKGAKNLKASQVTGKYSRLRKDQSVYLYCSNGKKSKRVAKKLSRDGYKSIYTLKDGFK